MKSIGKEYQAESHKGSNNLEGLVLASMKKLAEFVDPYDVMLERLRAERRQKDKNIELGQKMLLEDIAGSNVSKK